MWRIYTKFVTGIKLVKELCNLKTVFSSNHSSFLKDISETLTILLRTNQFNKVIKLIQENTWKKIALFLL